MEEKDLEQKATLYCGLCGIACLRLVDNGCLCATRLAPGGTGDLKDWRRFNLKSLRTSPTLL